MEASAASASASSRAATCSRSEQEKDADVWWSYLYEYLLQYEKIFLEDYLELKVRNESGKTGEISVQEMRVRFVSKLKEFPVTRSISPCKK